MGIPGKPRGRGGHSGVVLGQRDGSPWVILGVEGWVSRAMLRAEGCGTGVMLGTPGQAGHSRPCQRHLPAPPSSSAPLALPPPPVSLSRASPTGGGAGRAQNLPPGPSGPRTGTGTGGAQRPPGAMSAAAGPGPAGPEQGQGQGGGRPRP